MSLTTLAEKRDLWEGKTPEEAPEQFTQAHWAAPLPTACLLLPGKGLLSILQQTAISLRRFDSRQMDRYTKCGLSRQ